MKLGSLNKGRDGELIVVSRDLRRYVSAASVAPTLQAALDDWDVSAPRLQRLSDGLNAGEIEGADLGSAALCSPLPRAYEWVDGSAFLNHVRLVRKARGAEMPPSFLVDPLIYQGGSGTFLAPTDDIPLGDPAWGLDFESEVCVVLSDVPMGTSVEHAGSHIRLLMLANDVTLRNLIPNELAKGFGFFQSKPSTAFSPVAVTPDELGDAWDGERVNLKLRTTLNGAVVGDVPAREMHFSFPELIAHIAKTRPFVAGTILGSGTVSSEDRSTGISCLAERRMIEIIEQGAAQTPFLAAGDHVRIEMLNASGQSLFGAIDQTVRAVGHA